eukprot:TRINITY_DN2207_c0_g1_i1.p1 TRINITY_DN2207_c0_g1~~TRINITY_DN2207_c0_g1_i1.p1  ORF type:complete len:695 (+),score=53.72 TRINITY_DN2207_c0_g1_i1:32-2086(+)
MHPSESTLSLQMSALHLDNQTKLNNKTKHTQFIQGSIVSQMILVHFLICFLIIVSEITLLAPNIRFSFVLPYMFVTLVISCVSDMFFRQEKYSSWFLLSSLVPFCVAIIASREAHAQIYYVFFCGIIIVSLQTGDPDLRQRLVTFMFLYNFIYIILLTFMTFFYNDTSSDFSSFWKGIPLTTPISAEVATSNLCSVFILGLLFLNMQQFVKTYILKILTSERAVTNLQKQNQTLQKKLFSRDTNSSDDVNTPLGRIIKKLSELRQDPSITNENRVILDNISAELSSTTRLFTPQIMLEENNDIDHEINDWFTEIFRTDVIRGTSISNSSSRPSTPIEVDRTRSSIPKATLISRVSRIMQPQQTNQFAKVMDLMESWNFDSFTFARQFSRPMTILSYVICLKYDIPAKFNIKEDTLRSLLNLIEHGYRPVEKNPYHNNVHALDVTQACHYFISAGGLEPFLTDLEIFALFFAAFIHDFGHPGTSNVFHINSQTQLALLYNDKAILENHHMSSAWQMMLNSQFNIINELSPENQQLFRSLVIDFVLATDLKDHYRIMTQFNAKVNSDAGFDFNIAEDRKLILLMILKTSDVSNPARPKAIALQWANAVMNEFYRQGDLEKSQNLPLSAFCDRSKPQLAKCQFNFIKFATEPAVSALVSVLPNGDKMRILDDLKTNKRFYEIEANNM